MAQTQRGRSTPPTESPAASLSLEEQRAAQLIAVAQVEASMAGIAAAQELPVLADDLEQPAAAESAEQRYEAKLKAMPAAETRWKVGARAKSMKVEDYLLSRGDIVPGADAWPRRDSWESAGYIERA